MAEKRPTGPRREARKDWIPFPLRMPAEVDAEVRALAESDVLAPSVNTVIVTLLREALAARKRAK